MKKGLSVLLIAAALFGFYGGATNLNDVLACKDYFESASGASDDMQRLEDGLNQLKDNEQAYLDGQVALAEGEKTLADGKAQYAQGLADYKAAPGKLADGEKALKDLAKLIKGLKTAQKHGVSATTKHDKYWHDAFSKQLKPGRAQIVQGLKAAEADGSLSLLQTLTGTSDLASKAEKAGSYPSFDNVVAKQLVPTFKNAATALKSFAGLATQKAESLDGAVAAYNGLTAPASSEAPGLESIWSAKFSALGDCTAVNEYKAVSMDGSPYASLKPAFEQLGLHKQDASSVAPASVILLGGVGNQMSDFLNSEQGQLLQGIGAKGDPTKAESEDATLADKVAGIVAGMTKLSSMTGQGENDGAILAGYAPKVSAGLKGAATELEKSADKATENAALFEKWDAGYQTLAHAKDGKTSKQYKDDLASKKSGVPFAFKNMVTNKTIKAAIKQYDPSLMKILKKYTGNRLKNDSMEAFDKDIVYLGKKVIPRALKVLAKVKAEGQQTLAEGYKSYKEAPAKLADAEKQLADGEKQLADGKAQLAQYEDGEQQVRDGLATLVGTQSMGDVQGIADRIGNDTDFDNGDNHLELDEGLSAVEAGKGYASDLTAAVTDEIMSRAIATGLLIGAGVLAVLAALLSFLKKNKGAGVLAVLAAAAGCVGAFMGNAAGMQFSSIAGSTMGATPWVAAGILAAVAAVHAIVHFTAKKEA